jgi:cell division protease FtsH
MPYMSENRNLSEDTAKRIDDSMRAIINAAFDRALAKPTEFRDTLEAGAQRLLKQETLDEDDLLELQAGLTVAGVCTSTND